MDAFASSFFSNAPRFLPTLPLHHRRCLTISAVNGTVENHPQIQNETTTTPPPLLHVRPSCLKPPKKIAPTQPSNDRAAPPPPPPHSSSFAATLCNSLEDAINKFLEPFPLRPSVDPDHVLAGNFAPVQELPPTPCPVVKGRIPACLRGGAYVRNGPNPQHLPRRRPHHFFDGDGMLHSLLLSPDGDGRSPATLCSRYVHSHRYTVGREAGAPVLPNFFTFHSLAGVARCAVTVLRILTGQMNPAEGVSAANTSLAFFHDRLFALGEPDLPYAVHLSTDDGDVSTLGRSDFDCRHFEGMTAHPKKDPDTGEVFAFSYGPLPPFLTYFRFDGRGEKQPDVPIFSVRRPSFFHDFAITKRYAIFPDVQMVMEPLGMAFGGGSMFRSDPRKVSRVGLLPRYATSGSEMRWFDLPGFNPVHTINAWEDGDDAVVLVAPNVLNVEHIPGRMELLHGCVEMVRIDLKQNVVSRTPLSVRNLDLGVINPAYLGRKNRYCYQAITGNFLKITGVAKLDLELAREKRECVVVSREYEPGCFGGEPFFVAKAEGGDEDDGYVVSYLHDENNGESRFVVMDAKSPELEIVAEVSLPRRVPYGFHGIFVSQSDLRNQRR